ncbi:MAG: 16S rRNA (adenine(1518)-N(6)/adenine(1519)-N(6))-dimethyltransferase [Flavobacteriaceae bacterium]|nr:16S rRNA (adenine(1518)-N(6)/adenine(1519)-N(6))-dimethyltransferase [Flavobacteriaceae bacterium]|tara:strand:+ start:317318 stop:318121 length:804 start_codon:yes stop_codon:yes gene_type:complete
MSVTPKKHLGQHFLKDLNIAQKIADSLTYQDLDEVIEIGPGTGVLTKFVLQKNHKLSVFEVDSESVAYLKDDFSKENLSLNTSSDNFQIFEADFLKAQLDRLFSGKQVGIIGNYPYNISSQIVFKVLENRHMVKEFSGMFQKEVAQRIAEKKGSKTYGILSVLTQAFYEVEYLFTVPPGVFNPPPKVDSGVIQCIRKKNHTLPVDEKLFFRVVKTAFNQRRKMLRSSLKSFNLSQSLKEDPIFAKRPEQLSVEEFVSLTQKIASNDV